MTQDVHSLNLAPAALRAAIALQAQCPDVVFTSGRRDLAGQCAAMAGNVVHNRGWIAQTYVHAAARDAMQAWIDEHPHVVDAAGLATGLHGVLSACTDEDLRHVSAHLSGLAFDVQPVPEPRATIIKAAIRALPGLVKFLDTEGGLIRWHAEFA